MKLEMDKTNDVKRIFELVAEEYPDQFEFLLENTNFQFTTRSDPTYDEDGQTIAATASKLSNRERDLYGSDFEICVYEPYWQELDDTRKKRLIYHEMLHCAILEDEEELGEPAYDKDGRVRCYCVPHDLIIKTFKQEIEEFGLQQGDLPLAEFMHDQYELYLKQKSEHKNISTKKKKRRK